MTATSWNSILSFLAVLQILLASTKAVELALESTDNFAHEVSTSLDDYIKQNDRQYAEQIADYGIQIADFRTDFQRQLNIINRNSDFIERKIMEIDQKLYPLEFLNETTKYCVQRYSSLLVTTASVRSAITKCVNQQSDSLNSILSTPHATYSILENYYNTNWKNGLTDCARKANRSYTNHTICVTNLVAVSNTYFYNTQLSFTTQMDETRCKADSSIKAASECVFKTTDNSLSALAIATRLIDDCISGIGFCEPCKGQASVTAFSANCPNVIDITPNSQIYRNATIKNPFYGMNSSTECVLFNFNQLN